MKSKGVDVLFISDISFYNPTTVLPYEGGLG
jgi:hypothetical protein